MWNSKNTSYLTDENAARIQTLRCRASRLNENILYLIIAIPTVIKGNHWRTPGDNIVSCNKLVKLNIPCNMHPSACSNSGRRKALWVSLLISQIVERKGPKGRLAFHPDWKCRMVPLSRCLRLELLLSLKQIVYVVLFNC